MASFRTLLLLLPVLFQASGVGSAQKASLGKTASPEEKAFPFGDLSFCFSGTVVDLSRDAQGRILYCTSEGEVGRLTSTGTRTVLATGVSPNPLRGVAAKTTGDIALVDSTGDVFVLFGGVTPAVQVYDDRYMIEDATDLIVDAGGNYIIASATPTSGVRAVNWVSGDGVRWAYYLVKHAPVQLANDPLTGGIVIADANDGGNLQLVAAGSQIRATSGLDLVTHPGISAALEDGDVAAEVNGDLYWIAGGTVRKCTRSTHSSSTFASGFGQLRGIAIAGTSGLLPGSAWSLYVAEQAVGGTCVREIPGVGPPGSVVPNDQGWVPGRGAKINVNFGFQAYDLAADNDGRLLLGGSYYGTTHYLKRVTLSPTPTIATVATSANGLADIVEGVCVAPDDSIYTLGRNGTIQHITEGPLSVTTVFSDPANQVTAGKDLALDVDGTLYISCREAYGFGKVLRMSGGVASLLCFTEETRALAANPVGGMFVSQWHNTGFKGTVDLLHFADSSLEPMPGFSGINYANDYVWGDGDLCVDVSGAVYSLSEDDWSLVRYDPAQDGYVRIGSGYINRPSGLAIAPSTAGSGSSTGWSLYVSEFDFLWEKSSVPAPAATLVDSALGLRVGRTLAGVPDPKYGKPRVLAPDVRTGRVLIATSGGWVLALDPATGAIEPLAGAKQGLHGDLVALSVAKDGSRVLALDREGELFELIGNRARVRATDPERLAPVLERALAAPARRLRWTDSRQGSSTWLVLDGWVVWRTDAE